MRWSQMAGVRGRVLSQVSWSARACWRVSMAWRIEQTIPVWSKRQTCGSQGSTIRPPVAVRVMSRAIKPTTHSVAREHLHDLESVKAEAPERCEEIPDMVAAAAGFQPGNVVVVMVAEFPFDIIGELGQDAGNIALGEGRIDGLHGRGVGRRA